MKRLVVCCDGTWNTPEMASPTNVVRLARAVRPRDGQRRLQVLYYDEGVGTHGPVDKILGGALGEGLDANVRQAYRFIAMNYEPGDEIYLFGFSRGAYTVRSLAGMIGFAGMLGRDRLASVAAAYELYRDEKDPAGEAATAFRREHRAAVPTVTVLGCWDTVGAMGIPDKLPGIGLDAAFNKRYRWVDANLGPHVAHALHALAIDERRKEFAPTLMHRGSPEQTLKQVWFPGDHGSVGGGDRHKEPLARGALVWMVDRIKALGLGLAVEASFPDMLPGDHNAYFSRDRSPIYGRGPRDLGEAPEFADSALQRRADLPHYARTLGRAQRGLLAAAHGRRTVRGTLHRLTRRTVLGVGDSVDAVIHAARLRNDTKVAMVQGGRYELSVAETQCWRDGDLPPCGARGWRLEDPALAPFFDRLKRVKRPLIRLGRSKRVVADAQWFELVGVIRDADGVEETFRIGEGTTYTAPRGGYLLALANDIASRIDLLDSYDDNEGWLVLNVRRLA